MTEHTDARLEHVRDVLFGSERAELAQLRAKAEEVDALRSRVEALEALVLDASDRAEAVGEVIVPALESSPHANGALGPRLQPEVEAALQRSAREDSAVLAEALYPVMGPAIRKMIASLFSFGGGSGEPFAVEQIMVFERTSGVLLAATSSDPTQVDDADVVAGMLEAIRQFVRDAFKAPDHDGLQDLRVGDLAVLVEWGPQAVLASVVRGIPSDSYRAEAAATLEAFHSRFGEELAGFSGVVSGFDPATDDLDLLRTRSVTSDEATRRPWLVAVLVAVVLVSIVAVVWVL